MHQSDVDPMALVAQLVHSLLLQQNLRVATFLITGEWSISLIMDQIERLTYGFNVFFNTKVISANQMVENYLTLEL